MAEPSQFGRYEENANPVMHVLSLLPSITCCPAIIPKWKTKFEGRPQGLTPYTP